MEVLTPKHYSKEGIQIITRTPRSAQTRPTVGVSSSFSEEFSREFVEEFYEVRRLLGSSLALPSPDMITQEAGTYPHSPAAARCGRKIFPAGT